MPLTPAKYLINPLPAGGFPLENEDLLTLQEVPRTAVNAILSGLGTHFILSGCDVFDQDADAGTCYVNPGYVFIGGEVRYFAGNSGGIYPFYVVADTDSVTQKTFEDGNAKDAAVSLRTRIVTNRPTTGQFVTFNPNPVEKIATSITGALATALAREIADRNNADNALTAAIGTKQNRVTTRIPWTNLALATDFTSTENTFDTNSAFYGPAQYMRTEDGVVHLRGYLRCSREYSKSNSYGSNTIALLPTSCWPRYRAEFTKVITHNFYATTGAFQITSNYITAQDNGYLFVSTQFVVHDPAGNNTSQVQNARSDRTLHLDGISFSTEA